MVHHQKVRSIRIASISMGVLLLVLAISGCEPLEDTPPSNSSGAVQAGDLSAVQAGDLSDCRDLSWGDRDPIDGMPCVDWLQQALQENGYPNQKTTGFFGDQTKNNVLDFQRSHRIHPVSGSVGPKTRAALLGGGTLPADRTVRKAEPSDYRHSYCKDGACHFYLRRSTTRLYARRFDEHPAVGSVVTSTLLIAACRVFKAVKSANVICTIIGLGGGAVADYIANELDRAARQNACLRLSVRLLPAGPDWRLLTAAPDDSWRCSD